MNMNTKLTKTGAYFYNDESCNFEFTTTLSVSEKITFVNSIVDTIVTDNYNSLVRDLMFDYMVVKVMTDIDTSFIDNSESQIDSIEQFLNETSIVDIVKANMEIGLLESLNAAVDKAIEYRTGIHTNPLNDALASLLSTLEKKISEIDLGNVMEMAQKFAGITEDFTPESIVNAYMNSDIHQKNLNEIAKSKKNEIKIDENLGEAVRAIVEENKAEKAEY